MADSKRMMPATVDTALEDKMDVPHEQPLEPTRRPAAPPPAPPRAAGGSPLQIYKPGQGTYVRWGTAIGAGIICLAGSAFLYDQMPIMPGMSHLAQSTFLWVRTLVPVIVMVIAAIVIYRLVGCNHTIVDFTIATEGEMKKVNWSSRKEIIGATKVVIVTLLALAGILFVIDLFFMFFFSAIGVLRVDLFANLFGRGGGQ